MSTHSSHLLQRLGIRLPIIQAPMAGVSSPAMAAAVSNSGGLGSLGVGAMHAAQAREAIRQFRALSDGPLNINVFTHRPAHADAARESAWLQRLGSEFARTGTAPPQALREIYTSFLADPDMLAMLLEEKPRVVSFHFGLPAPEQIAALHRAGIVLLASATNTQEAQAIAKAGIDAVIAQGYEAGGHRGMFDPDAADSQLGSLALTRVFAQSVPLPVIAAGGIMDGAGIAAALALGASAAQLGTAFVATDESLADAGYRQALFSDAAHHTVMTRVISGRPARSLANAFTHWGSHVPAADVPDYPIAYDAGKALNAAGKAAGQPGYGAQWAGQGAPLARKLPTAALMQTLAAELEQARR
ncbi:NAD(P)H-dependent flavin oxidoreductase [Dyella acidiphila]|uniref:Propionate 3-nitronate monooxygenase n=1 Tax=Dyella acidiphila TaxID=2775866 RepID=A0ABR9GAB5_9GAMM|nr:nitronate monooxygenase [Dyella acidiphila]MBE1160944.1 nitronate monooxygenase [Dyella acidiphila]